MNYEIVAVLPVDNLRKKRRCSTFFIKNSGNEKKLQKNSLKSRHDGIEKHSASVNFFHNLMILNGKLKIKKRIVYFSIVRS